MKAGDLVKMKYESSWRLRQRQPGYTSQFAIVLERSGPAIKVLMPDGRIKASLAGEWRVVNEQAE